MLQSKITIAKLIDFQSLDTNIQSNKFFKNIIDALKAALNLFYLQVILFYIYWCWDWKLVSVLFYSVNVLRHYCRLCSVQCWKMVWGINMLLYANYGPIIKFNQLEYQKPWGNYLQKEVQVDYPFFRHTRSRLFWNLDVLGGNYFKKNTQNFSCAWIALLYNQQSKPAGLFCLYFFMGLAWPSEEAGRNFSGIWP